MEEALEGLESNFAQFDLEDIVKANKHEVYDLSKVITGFLTSGFVENKNVVIERVAVIAKFISPCNTSTLRLTEPPTKMDLYVSTSLSDIMIVLAVLPEASMFDIVQSAELAMVEEGLSAHFTRF